MRELQQRVMDTLLPFLEGYIWQRDVFTLQSSYKAPPPWGYEARSATGKSTYCGPPCLWVRPDLVSSLLSFMLGVARPTNALQVVRRKEEADA